MIIYCITLHYYDMPGLLSAPPKLYQMKQFITNVISSQMTFQSIKFFLNKDIICFGLFHCISAQLGLIDST